MYHCNVAHQHENKFLLTEFDPVSIHVFDPHPVTHVGLSTKAGHGHNISINKPSSKRNDPLHSTNQIMIDLHIVFFQKL